MATDATSMATAGAIGLGLTAAAAVPSCLSIWHRLTAKKLPPYEAEKLYEDEDGQASAESQAAFSTTAPRCIALISTLLGLAASVTLAVFVTIDAADIRGADLVETWLRVGSWLVIAVQALAVFQEPECRQRFNLGAQAGCSCLVNVASLVAARAGSMDRDLLGDTQIGLLAAQVVLALVALTNFVTIPRRPTVFAKGRPVDGEMTASLLGRLSYAWGARLVRQAQVNRNLEYDDLPQLSRRTRARTLSERFKATRQCSRLWRTIVLEFRWSFAWQFGLVISKSILMFVPQLAMMKLLQILEGKRHGLPGELWLWVLLLGLAMIVASAIENWLFFTIWTKLGIPVRNMLSALIFEKSMRRKDVKGSAAKKKDGAQDQPAVNQDSGPLGESSAVEGSQEEQAEEDVDEKTRQGTVNLVGVDSQRIAMFATFAYFYPGTITQIVVSVWFLANVIGMRSLLVGLAAFCVTIPLNIWAARNYTHQQSRLMDLRDKKLGVLTEALQGIRQIKFSALEQEWQDELRSRRRKELHAQKWAYIYDTFLISCYILSPMLLGLGCLGTYALLNGGLEPSVAFTTMSVLSALEAALGVLPELTTDGIDAWISVNRINDYLDAPEIVNCLEPSDRIAFDHADIAWPADEEIPSEDRFVLRNVNISIPPKELTVISGKTGSGKSLLLASVLGEIDKLGGTIHVPKAPPLEERFDSKATPSNWIIDSAIAFVAQIPWIENATVRDNILFGLPYDQGRYRKTLEACALAKDMEMFEDGDTTEIGHNGVNLSGGQKWRLSFARALYSRAGILVLDDVFSAVDAHVGRQMYEQALTGELSAGRTRILVTHHVSLVLPKTKYAVHLADGTVQYAGFVEQLQKDGNLSATLKEDPDVKSEVVDEPQEHLEVNGHNLTKVMSRRSERSAIIDDGGADGKPKDKPRKFVEDEKRETGAIKAAVYKTYIVTSGSFMLWIPIALIYVLTELLEVGQTYWVTLWSRSYGTSSHPATLWPASFLQTAMRQNATFEQLHVDENTENTLYYLAIYALVSVGAAVFGTIKYTAVYVASLRASHILFEQLTHTVLRAPLRWFDTVPVGRVLNRFTGDFNVIDSWIAPHFSFMLYKVFQTLGITAVSFAVSTSMVPLAAVLWAIAGFVAYRFITAARSIKRLENNAKSPIFELFGSCLTGIVTIRGFAKPAEYVERMWERIDQHGRSYWNLWLMNRWMGFRLSMIGAFFTICVTLTIVAGSVDAALAGFALTFALEYSEAIIWVLRQYANVELDMTACERVMEFSSMETEAQGGAEPPAAWPTEGRLEVNDLVCGYAPELPPVLKGLSFRVERGQRVGVVGRTGAGKSSLTLALFRFLEAREGSILVDGIDIASITLHALRSRLAIIPQDPVLFSGSVRSNLDPFKQHADASLRDALARVHLTSGGGSAAATGPPTAAHSGAATPTAASVDQNKNTNVFSSLGSRISEGGLNLSQGQRQLLCLARAIVARPRLMVLDEATSAVDKETDELIQRSIREEFHGSTLLVIAHRLSTIADFDRILVMGDGRVLEFGSPAELLARQGGTFRDMVQHSGEREALEEIIAGGAAP